jgi:hypothetical protein
MVLDNPCILEQDDTMNKRPLAKPRSNKVKDAYLLQLDKIWPAVLRAYEDFKDIKPIIEYQLREKIVYAYPGLPYIEDLTERTREQTRRIYQDAIDTGRFMVFVSDSRERVLRSYVFPIKEPGPAGSRARSHEQGS